MINVLALFDFDGTITSRDTLWEVIRYQKGSMRLATGLLLLSPALIAYRLKLLSNTRAKQAVMSHFFRDISLDIFQKNCDRFAAEVLPSLIRPAALKEIKRHQDNGTRVLIVSASPENWLTTWCLQTGVECIATRLEVMDNRLTGKIRGKNCHGPEKLRRIKQVVNPMDYDDIYAYGDTRGDLPMLGIAHHSFYKPFR